MQVLSDELIHDGYVERDIIALRDMILNWGKRKGWHNENIYHNMVHNVEEKLLLTVTEIAEATEELRNGHSPCEMYYSVDNEGKDKPEGFAIELADAVIRIIHLCGLLHIDLPLAIKHKMAYNESRPYRYGGKLS